MMIDRQHAIDVEFADLRKSTSQPESHLRSSGVGAIGRVVLAFVAIYAASAVGLAAIDGFSALADATKQATLIGLALGLSGLFAFSD